MLHTRRVGTVIGVLPEPRSVLRIERCFAFTDLCGFTAFTFTHGDEAARAELITFRSALRNIVDAHGVRVAKWLGDGSMLVGVDIDPVVDALLDLHSTMRERSDALAIRSGVSYGSVMVFEGDDYIGTTVNLAARLCDEARDDEILATRALADLATRELLTDEIGPSSVRGVHEPIDIVRILGRPSYQSPLPTP